MTSVDSEASSGKTIGKRVSRAWYYYNYALIDAPKIAFISLWYDMVWYGMI